MAAGIRFVRSRRRKHECTQIGGLAASSVATVSYAESVAVGCSVCDIGMCRHGQRVEETVQEKLPGRGARSAAVHWEVGIYPLFSRGRKCEPLILVPTNSTIAHESSAHQLVRESSVHRARESSVHLWSSGCTLAGVYSNGEGNAEGCIGAQSAGAGVAGSLGFESAVKRGSSRRTRAEMEGEKAAVIVAAEELVQRVMGTWDSSHDPFHALRVRDLALSLASEEGLRLSSFPVVELAALLHDIDDHKYAARGERVDNVVESFLKEHNVESNTAEAVLKIVTTMGFKEELGASGNDPISPEFAVVQDADRLDAIGAIGIARAFTYGGSRNRMIHDPAQAPRMNLTKSEYTQGDVHPTTINHFAEKLLKLKDLMKSQAGKRRAQQRHEFMLSFLQEFQGEWDGKY